MQELRSERASPRVEKPDLSIPFFPRRLTAVSVPPIKCQGIKTRLVRFIAENLSWDGRGRWIEPFLGSGVVGFNLAPGRALLADSNRHIIAFYRAVQQGRITSDAVRSFLEDMDAELRRHGEPFYYTVRERFNRTGEPLDLLFLNRASFNGVMRFNRQGGFNVPFGKKVERFRPAYVTKIANQVRRLEQALQDKDWQFVAADWRERWLRLARAISFISIRRTSAGTPTFNAWYEPEAMNWPECAEICLAAMRSQCGRRTNTGRTRI